jgi:hypothetical protein
MKDSSLLRGMAMLYNSRGLNLGVEIIKDVSKDVLIERARRRVGVNLRY